MRENKQHFGLTIFLTCLLLFFFHNCYATEAFLTNITVLPLQNGVTQIILNFDQPVAHKAFTLDNPKRFVIDFPGVRDSYTGKSIDFSQTPIKDFRHGIQNGLDLRLVFDLEQPIQFSSTTNTANGFQLIFTVMTSGAVTPTATTEPTQLQTSMTSTVVSSPKTPAVTSVTATAIAPTTTAPTTTTSTSAVQVASSTQSLPPVQAAAPVIVSSPATVPVSGTSVSNAGSSQTTIQTPTTTSTPPPIPTSSSSMTAATPISGQTSQQPASQSFTISSPVSSAASSVSQSKRQPITTSTQAQANTASTMAASNTTQPSDDSSDMGIVVLPHRSKHIFTVVIDAGHGGKDPGTTGPTGIHEKNVTLAIAKDLEKLVDKQPGMHAVMTRNGDYYVGLRQRLMIARQKDGDIFIAIHADAYNDPDATGASVFALSLHGATSEAALWLAQKENYSELGGIDLNGIQDQDAQVRSVLIDLSQTATIGASLQLGTAVIKQLGKITQLHHGFVEQAPFMVLKSPDIPSILVETGFLTNAKEEARLSSASYQQTLAQALMNGINQYYTQSAPRNMSFVSSR